MGMKIFESPNFTPMNIRNRILAGSIALFAFTAIARAVTDTWDGGGGDNNLSTNNNWVDNSAPASDIANTDLIFGGGIRLTPAVSVAFSANSLVFNNTAGAFSFS